MLANACLMYVLAALVLLPCSVESSDLLGECDQERYNRFPSGWPRELDYGIYWFGRADASEKATGAASKFYDPDKNTMIFIHGWTGNAGGWTKACYRATTQCAHDLCPDQRMLADGFLDAGWNVGYFFWDQFADEECARDAEQKVWFDRLGLRWARYTFGEKSSERTQLNLPQRSIGELCAHSLETSLSGFQGQQLRIVGHSLGTQVAAKCAEMLHTSQYTVKPTRVVLLDPFFTTLHLHGMLRCSSFEDATSVGDYTVKKATSIIMNLFERGVPTEMRLSSPFPENSFISDTVIDFEPLVVMIKAAPTWCGSEFSMHALTAIGCRHKAAVVLYLLGFEGSKAAANDEAKSCNPVATLGCTDRQLWYLQEKQQKVATTGYQQYWKQIAGMSTRTFSDDEFEPKLQKLSFNAQGTVAEFLLGAAGDRDVHEPGLRPRRAWVRTPLTDAGLIGLSLCGGVAFLLAWRSGTRTWNYASKSPSRRDVVFKASDKVEKGVATSAAPAAAGKKHARAAAE